jgi:hypothetical protein
VSRVRIRIGPVTINGREYPGTAHNGREGTIVHVDVDDEGLFGLVVLDGEDVRTMKLGFKSLEMIGGEP